MIKAKAKFFFVATIEEGKKIRTIDQNVKIYVLQGLYEDSATEYIQSNITPVINTYEQALKWNKEAKKIDQALDYAIHYDIGMSRTGMILKTAYAS